MGTLHNLLGFYEFPRALQLLHACFGDLLREFNILDVTISRHAERARRKISFNVKLGSSIPISGLRPAVSTRDVT